MKNKLSHSVCLIALVLSVSLLSASTRTIGIVEFSGSWFINLDKSQHGERAPKMMILIATGATLSIERTSARDLSFVEKVRFDEQPFFSTTTSGRRKTASAKLTADGRSFIETAIIDDGVDPDKVAFNLVEAWQLSPDGKQMSVVTDLSNAAGASSQSTAVYHKQ